MQRLTTKKGVADMKQVLYADDDFEVIQHDDGDINSKYVHYIPSGGEFVAVLPYRKHFAKTQYLVKRERVLAWDNHPDLCCITIPLKYQPEVSAAHVLKEVCDIKINQSEFFHLGVCTASRRSDDVFYLYAVDLSQHEEIEDGDHYVWVDQEKLIASNDAQLITLYTRACHIL